MRNNAALLKIDHPATGLHDKFLQDAHDLFSGKKQGNMGMWRYDDGGENDPAAGAVLWERLVNHATSYYVSRSGDQSVIDNLQRIADYVGHPGCTVVDLGPGKVRDAKIQLLQTLSAKGVYAPVDISYRFLSDALHLKEKGIVQYVYPVKADFTADTIDIPFQGKRVFVFLGSSIGNIQGGPNTCPRKHVLGLLTQIKSQMRHDDVLVVGFDSCTDEDHILQAYRDPYSIDVMLAPLFKVERDLNPLGSFDPEAFAPEFLWFPQTGQCAHTVVSRKEQRIVLDNQIYSIPEGKRLHLSNSYKFEGEEMTGFFSRAGFSDIEILQKDNNPMKLILARL